MEEDQLPTESGGIDELGPQELREIISKIAAEKAELEDRYLRKHADFENYRKRMTKEKSESIQYANSDLMKDLLDVLDNLQRAQDASMAEGAHIDSVREGIDLIAQTLYAALSNRGLARMDALEKEFDPEHHQAIAQAEADVQMPTVIEVYQPGYLLFERVLRPAMVRVAMPGTVEKKSESDSQPEVDLP
ncbi:MAG: nucleotide exchange factor GrpE [Spirochaetia bacterium]